jgi:uncharacterized repeat protein (TIGR01451 family)
MYHRLSGKLLRIALPFVLAVLSLALLLGLFAGPQKIVHALSQRAHAEADDGLASIELEAPVQGPLASPRPPQLPLQEVTQAPRILTVCGSGCDYADIQDAVNNASAGDTIKVDQGTYIDQDGDGIVVEITKTLTLLGGYDAASSNWDDPDPDANPTVLDGQTDDRVIHVGNDAAPRIEGFEIERGFSSNGAGVYVASGSPTLARSRIHDNVADQHGGGLYVVQGNARVENCLIYDNSADKKRGGGMYVANGSATVRFNVFYGNQAQEEGGGIYVANGSPNIVGNILSDNTAFGDPLLAGGGVYVAGGSPSLDYNAYYQNAGGHAQGFTPSNSLVGIDPEFVNPSGKDFDLNASSPCIDPALTAPAAYPSTDYEGIGRPFGTHPDIGAYEVYLGTCFARADDEQIRSTVQQAVADAGPGDVVKIAGVCTGTGTNPVVNIGKDLTLRGGYTLTNWTDPDPDLYATVLDGETARRVIDAGNWDVTIEGLHIRNGYITGIGQFGGGIRLGTGDYVIRHCRIYLNESEDDLGGGIYLGNGTILIEHNQIYSNTSGRIGGGGLSIGGLGTIRDNDIFDNVAVGTGGGLRIANSTVRVENNRVYLNTLSGYGGGGMYVEGGDSTIIGNAVYSNTQSGGNNGGGGIYLYHGASIVERNAIYGNSADATIPTGGGGGIYIEEGSSVVKNNLVYSNSVAGDDEGGGLYRYLGGTTIENNTFYGNQAGTTGGGMYIEGGSGAIRNNIVVSNVNGEGVAPGNVCQYCDVWGNTSNTISGTWSISVNPLFVQPGVDFHLQSGSQCRDNATSPYPAYDYDGYARPFGAAADIGAHEYYEGDCFARLGTDSVYPTVQEAIDAAGTDDPIYVAGVCTASGAPVADIAKQIRLLGGYTLTNWLTPSTGTILEGDPSQRVVEIAGSDPVIVDGFIIRGGGLAPGAGLYNQSSGDVEVYNIVFYDNAPGSGSVLGSAGGNVQLYNNTLVDNDVGGSGWVIDIAAGSATVSNTIIVSNTGNALSAGTACTYCDIKYNTGSNSANGPSNLDRDPRFIDYAGDDFRLRSDSHCVYAGDPATDVDRDFEGDPRPLGNGYDIGADECAFYPGLLFEPKLTEVFTGAPGQPAEVTYYLTNTGGVADTFELTYSLHVSGVSVLWDVIVDPLIGLEGGASTPVPVTILVPSDEISGSVGTVVLTATSQLNPALYEVVTNVTYISWNPGVTITPVYTDYLNPGDTYTQANTIYLHTLLNTGNAPDSFTLTFSSLQGWSGITPTVVSNLAPGASATLWLTVIVPPTTPGGVTETLVVTAVNSSLEAWAVITNAFEVNQVPGDRYVSVGATKPDKENNCLVDTEPCRTLGHALDQAVNGDTIKVAPGTYREFDLLLNKAITVAGGYTTDNALPSWWGPTNPDPRPDPELNVAVVDAEGQGRVIEIWGNPIVFGLTLRGGWTPGSGGGVYIGTGSPVLRKNKIVDNTAANYGGGAYNWFGSPTMEQNILANNAANRGGGFATSSSTFDFWTNVLYGNSAATEGGGVYVLNGSPRIWHSTLYDNDAAYGGGIYLAGSGSPVVSNTIVVSNVATTSGGGVYSQAAGASLDYNNVRGNTNGDYVGLSAGPNSVAYDPLFLDPGRGDLHLQPNSPVGDIADTSVISEDLDGDPRSIGLGPDIGADEFRWGTILFTPSYSGLISHCLSISYTHLLTHTGRYTDTFAFEWQSTQNVTVTIVPPEVTLGHDMTTTIDVTIEVPCTLVGPLKDTTRITAVSKSYTFITNSVTETTYIDVVPLLALEPDREAYSPPGTVHYTHTLTNAGNYTDTIRFDYWSQYGWGVAVPGPIALGPNSSTVLTVAVTIEGDVVSGTVQTTVITATSMFSDMINGIPMSATVVDTTTVGPRPGVHVWKPDPTLLGICIYPPENNVAGPYPYYVQNTGNLTDTFDFTLSFEVPRTWTVTATFDWIDWYTMPFTATFAPEELRSLWVYVEVPSDTMPIIIETLTLSVTSQADPAEWDSVDYVLKIIDIDVQVDGPVTQTFVLEPSISYQHRITNESQIPNHIQLKVCDPRIWPPPPGWLGRSFDPFPIYLDVGQSGLVTVTLSVPMDVHTATVELCLVAETQDECYARDRVWDTILVRRPDVTIEPDRNPQDDPEARVIPGTIVTYTYSLSNTGFLDDDYTITWTLRPSPAWPTWTVSVSPTFAPDMEPGDEIPVVAVMTIPAGMPAGETGRLVITATSKYTDAIFDIAVADMVVPPMPMARITPNHKGEARPDSYITYTHLLTNVGNVPDWFEITTHSEFAVSQVLSPSVVYLEPMQAFTQVVVRLYIPPHAEIGSVEHTRVIVSFGEEDALGRRPQVVAIDLTTILPITGTRYVSTDGTDEGNNCTDPQNFGACATIQHAVDQAWHGDEVRVAGGTYTDVHSTAGVTQVVYLDKSLALRGGYVITDWDTFDPEGNPTVLNAGGQGRVIHVDENLAVTVAGLYLTGGYVEGDGARGAGIYIAAGTMLTLERNEIYGNALEGNGTQGGGVYYDGPDGVLFQQNTLHDNQAEDGSGAYLVASEAWVQNNVFCRNDASGLGGGTFLDVAAATLWNNTFYSNTADLGGGVYYDHGSGSLVISNTIFAVNLANETDGGGGVYWNSGTPSLDWNDYWQNTNGDALGSTVVPTGSNSLQANPEFFSEPAFDLHLTANSPCVDRADPATALHADRDGKTRPLLDGCDIGAYEYGLEFVKRGPANVAPGQNIVYTIVITNSGGLGQANVPVTDTLSPYLEFVGSPTGQYIPATRTITWTVSVPAYSQVQLQFTARVTDNLAVGTVITNAAWVDLLQTNVVTSAYRTCWVRLNDDPTDYTTVQAAHDDSQDVGDVVKVAGTCSGVNARGGLSQTVYLSKTLTVQGGYAPGNWNTPDPRANPTRLDAQGLGRVIYITGTISPTIEGLFIVNGDATGLGGHASGDAGGGVYVVTAKATLAGNVILSNTADVGGGVCLLDSESRLVNNAIVDNQANTAGSGLYVDGNDVTMLHNTLARNGGTAGQGIYVIDLSSPATVALTNTIVATHTVGIQAAGGSTAIVSGVLWYDNSSDTLGAVLVSEQRTGDPAFGVDGYHLTVRSAARDRGIDAGIVVDIDGESRLGSGAPDLGADEVPVGLEITKVASLDPVYTGQQLGYTIHVTNTGQFALDVILTDTLPSQVTPTGVITWDLGTLMPDQSVVRTFAVTVTAGYSGPLVNRVDVASTDGVTATYTLTSYAQGTVAISVTKTVEPFSAQAGEQITYTIYVTNVGDIDLSPTVIDTPPADATPSSPQVYALGVLAPGGSVSWTLVVTPDLGYSGLLTNVVRATSPEGATAAYTLTSQVNVSPGVSITKVGPGAVQAGDMMTYTIYVTNTGNVTLTATITEHYPANVSPLGPQTWPGEQLGVPNGVWSTTVNVMVDWGYEGWLTNVVVVEDATYGVSDVYTLYTWVGVTPALTLTKVASDDPVQAGDMLTYTVYVTNTGNVTLTLTVTDLLPLNASPGGTWTSPAQLGVPNGTWSTTVHVTPDLGYEGWLTNVVVVENVMRGVREAYTLTTRVDVTPAVTGTKVASDDPVQAGDMLTYTIYVTNTGNVTLTLTITEYYPANTTPTVTDTWTGIELGVPNGTWSTTVHVTPNLGYAGWLTNVVFVTSTRGANATFTETTLSLAPYLSVTKQVSDDPVQAGDPLTYTIYVTNTGTVPLTLSITDTLPTHVTHVTATTMLTWTPQTPLALGDVWTATVPVVVQMGYSGTLTNVVDVTSAEGATGTFTLLSEARVTPAVSVTKVAALDPVQAGDVLTYTVYVTNTGNVTLNLTITDILPAHVTHITATNALTWTPVLTAPDDTWTGQFTVTVDMGYSGTLTNTVDVTSREGATNTFTLLTQARVTPQMSVTKEVDPPVLLAGGQLTYTIWVTNTGNVTLTTAITDYLDPNVTHITATNVLTWTPVLTAPGGTWSTQFTVTVDAGYPGTVTNVVWVYADEGATGVATATALSLAPAVTITKWVDPPVVQAGEQLTYTIVVTNNGTLELTGLVLTDARPARASPTGIITFARPSLLTGTTWTEQIVVTAEWGYSGTLVNDVLVNTAEGVSATYSLTSYAAVSPAISITKRAEVPAVLAGNPITFTIYVTNTGNVTLTATVTEIYPANAAPAGTITWTRQLTQFSGTWVLTTVVTPNVGYAGWLTNVVEVTADGGATDRYTETVLSLAPYLSVAKVASEDPVQAGDVLTYTIYVTNTGTMPLNLTVTDTLPLDVVPNAPQVWTGMLPLAPGLVWTTDVPVMVRIGYSGTLTNMVDVTSTEGATGTFALLTQARVTPALSVTKHVHPAIVEPGGVLTYTIWVTNTGNVTLTTTITDYLDPNVTHITATSVLTWSPVLTAPGGTWSTQFTVTANAGYVGPLLNLVQVTSDEGATGSDIVLSAVCVPFTDLTLQGPTLGSRDTNYAFTATVAPPTVTMPITYTWEATGHGPQVRSTSVPSDVETFSWTADGTYAVTVTVDNGCGAAFSRTHVITISGCPFPLTDVTVGGPGSGYVDVTYVFTSALVPPNATTPLTYTWSPPPNAGPQGQPDAQYEWATPGSYDVTLEVENCGGTVSRTHTIVIHPPCVGVSGVTVSGPRTGVSNTLYSFVAHVSPAGASTPMTYTWSPPPASGQGTATAQYQWPADGSYTISVTVENCGGAVSDDHTITIQPVQPVYLPLVMRNYIYAPDLEVTAIQIYWGAGANPDYVQVTIRNNGPAPVTSDFWVDLYLDPSRVPTVGDLWNDLGSQGKAWFMRDPTILSGGTIVLDTRDPDDPADPLKRYSNWPDQLPAGAHALYVQADSYWRPSGMIVETDETNNVTLQTYMQGTSQSGVPTPPSPPVLDTPVPIATPKPRPTPKEQATPTLEP